MTGVAHAVLAGRVSAAFTITMGNSLTFYGYNGGSPFGSISPSTLKGSVISNIMTDTQVGSPRIQILIAGSGKPQNFFSSLQVQDTSGSMVTLTSASADGYLSDFGGFGTHTIWAWSGTPKIWTATTPSPRLVSIFY